MSERSETAFTQLERAEAIQALVGVAEDSELEFKEWRSPEANSGSITKAACAFANATGGVLVIGVIAANRREEPDVATGFAPVEDPEAVKALVLDIIAKRVDPGVVGVKASAVITDRSSGAGVVVVHVPEAALPQRSRLDNKFYTRVVAGTMAMEMYQIADRFGRRPQPRLSAVEPVITYGQHNAFTVGPQRKISVRVKNEGRGLAQFPALFLKANGLLGSNMYMPEWTLSGTDEGWTCYRGGADKVVYPGETRSVVDVFQNGQVEGGVASFAGVKLHTKVVCLDMVQQEQVLIIGADDSTSF